MQGQSIFYTMPRTLCNSNGPCTVLAGNVGIEFANGKEATPAQGTYFCIGLGQVSRMKKKD
jgi:hypothetical protein